MEKHVESNECSKEIFKFLKEEEITRYNVYKFFGPSNYVPDSMNDHDKDERRTYIELCLTIAEQDKLFPAEHLAFYVDFLTECLEPCVNLRKNATELYHAFHPFFVDRKEDAQKQLVKHVNWKPDVQEIKNVFYFLYKAIEFCQNVVTSNVLVGDEDMKKKVAYETAMIVDKAFNQIRVDNSIYLYKLFHYTLQIYMCVLHEHEPNGETTKITPLTEQDAQIWNILKIFHHDSDFD